MVDSRNAQQGDAPIAELNEAIDQAVVIDVSGMHGGMALVPSSVIDGWWSGGPRLVRRQSQRRAD